MHQEYERRPLEELTVAAPMPMATRASANFILAVVCYLTEVATSCKNYGRESEEIFAGPVRSQVAIFGIGVKPKKCHDDGGSFPCMPSITSPLRRLVLK